MDGDLENYRIPEAARALQDFVDEMSNWYVRRSRERFWAQGQSQDKQNAYMTLYTALVTVAKLAAPMVPFMTEDIYQNLVRSIDATAPESIHLCDYPVADQSYIDRELEQAMDQVLQIVVLGRAARNGANIKNRQPVANLYVKADCVLDEMFKNIIADELNIKAVHMVEDAGRFTSYSFKPQLKILGQKYGKKIGEIRQKLTELDGSAAKAQLDATGSITLALSDGDISLTEEELLIETAQAAGYETVSDRGITVALDTQLTEALIEEGFVREIISKVQSMRKEADFNVLDHICLYHAGNDKIAAIIDRNRDTICHDVLADKVVSGQTAGFVMDWKVNGEAVTFGVEVIG